MINEMRCVLICIFLVSFLLIFVIIIFFVKLGREDLIFFKKGLNEFFVLNNMFIKYFVLFLLVFFEWIFCKLLWFIIKLLNRLFVILFVCSLFNR